MRMKKLICFGLSLIATTALAANDPACVGKNQDVCDFLGMMLIARGKLCYKMISVTPLQSMSGGDRYRIVCQETSTSTARLTYTLDFGPGNKSYEVY